MFVIGGVFFLVFCQFQSPGVMVPENRGTILEYVRGDGETWAGSFWSVFEKKNLRSWNSVFFFFFFVVVGIFMMVYTTVAVALS